jgi:DNA-binding GntR family transcriptional regulator
MENRGATAAPDHTDAGALPSGGPSSPSGVSSRVPPGRGGGTVAGLPQALGASDLPSQISGILEEAIISGVLEPGQRLRAEVLATHYGVSRIPVREALRSLEAAGWVKIKPRYGVYVAERSEEELVALFDVRSVLEAHVARRAAERRTESDLDRLRSGVEMSRRAAERDDGQALTGLSADFYATLRAATHNSVLEATAASLAKRARFYFATVAEQLGRDWVHTHEHLLLAVERRDADAAARVSREHIEETGRAVQKLLADR